MAENGALGRWVRNGYWREVDARAVLEAWRESGETMATFARRHGIQRGRLERWSRRLRESGPEVRFHPVRVVSAPASPERTGASNHIELQLATGHRIRVAPGFDPEDLRRVLFVIGQVEGC